MAGRSARVQARAYKYNQAHKRQQEILKNLQVNANFYKVLEGAGRPPSRPSRGHLQGGRSGWVYSQVWTGKSSSDFRPQRIMRDKWEYQYQKGVDQVVIGRRTYGPGRVDARIEWKGEEDWKRKINEAYWRGEGMQDDIAKQKARLSGWKAFDPSTVGSSRGMGGSRLGTSSSVVSVGGGYASGSTQVTNVGKVAAGLKDGSIVAGKDSRGNTAFVTASKTEASKATATGVAKYGSGFATGFESTPDKSFAVDAQGKQYTSWDELKTKGKRTPKTPVGKMAEGFISDFEAAGLDTPDGSVDPETMHKYFDTEIAGLQAQLDSGYITEGGKQEDGSWSPLTYKAIAVADAQSLKDQISAKQLARASFMTGAQQKARAEEINVSTIEQQKVKAELEQYMGKGSNYLNPEQYSQKLKKYQDEETHVRGLVGSSYRELLYGEDIRLDTDRLTGKKTFRNLTEQEQMFQTEDMIGRKDRFGKDIMVDAKQLEGIKKSRQRGQIQYDIPDTTPTRDPSLQRSRFRKIIRRTEGNIPLLKEEISSRETSLATLREQEKSSDVQYRAYLTQIQTKTQASVDAYRTSGGSNLAFDDSFGSELRQFGTKRKQLQLDIAVEDTELDALKKNLQATEKELERLKKLKIKMGGDAPSGGGGRPVNPARIKLLQAKRGYGSAIMSKGERSARARAGATVRTGSRQERRKARLEARGLVVGEGRQPDSNKFAFDVLRSLQRERRRIIG